MTSILHLVIERDKKLVQLNHFEDKAMKASQELLKLERREYVNSDRS